MSNSSSLFIVCLNPEESKVLTNIAAVIGCPDAEIALGSMAEAIRLLNARTSPPANIIIDIGTRGKDVLSEIDELALHCDPNVNVVVIGSVNDITFYRELKQRGISEYFSRPAQGAEVRNALTQASLIKKQQRMAESGDGIVVSCMSAASGDGSSTLAVNLAHCLAEEFKQSTVLVDMDYQFGLIAKALDLTAPFGIRELFDHPERGLDGAIVEKMLVKYGERLSIISTPNELLPLPSIDPELIHDLIKVLRSKFKVVVIDVPHILTPWTAASIKHADHNYLVGQLWLRSLTHAKRVLNAWHASGVASENTSLIINRSGAKFKEAVGAEEFERICHQKIDAYLLNDIKALVSAENQGQTVYEAAAETSQLPKQFKQIAVKLMERFNITAAPTPAAEPASKKGLKGLFDKKASS